MRIPKQSTKRYLLLHLFAVAVLLLFPLYRLITNALPSIFSRCVLHDRLLLYCPLCGGTRAVSAILQGDFASALAYNPLVVVLGIGLILFDLVALVRLLRGREPLFPVPRWGWAVLVGCLVAYGILRNYLMIAHGYDPIGDLGAFWIH